MPTKENTINVEKAKNVNHKKSNSMLTIDLQKLRNGPQFESFFRKSEMKANVPSPPK